MGAGERGRGAEPAGGSGRGAGGPGGGEGAGGGGGAPGRGEGGDASAPLGRVSALFLGAAWVGSGRAAGYGTGGEWGGALAAAAAAAATVDLARATRRSTLARSWLCARRIPRRPPPRIAAAYAAAYVPLAAHGLALSACWAARGAPDPADAPALRRSLVLFSSLFTLETAFALALDVAVHHHWSRRDYTTHHLPWFLLLGGPVALAPATGRHIVRALPRALALILCTGMNEAVFAWRTAAAGRAGRGADGTRDRGSGPSPRAPPARGPGEVARCAYLLAVMAVLVPCETLEIGALIVGPGVRAPVRLLAATYLYAPLLHVLDIVPANVRRLWRMALAATR